MSAVPWIIGGVALGVGILYVRNAAAKKAADDKDKNTSACASVIQPIGRMLGFDLPPQACDAVDSVVGKIGNWLNEAERDDADNKRLNGEVEVPLAPDLKNATLRGGAFGSPSVFGTVARFKNGCQPYVGAPGWGKCVAGTHDMLAGNAQAYYAPTFPDDTGPTKMQRQLMFTGKPGDPFSGRGASSPGVLSGKSYVAGREITKPCPGQTAVRRADIARDHTNGQDGSATQWCGGSTGPGNTVRVSATGVVFGTYTDGPHERTNVGELGEKPPPGSGYVWVPTFTDGGGVVHPGHYERERAP